MRALLGLALLLPLLAACGSGSEATQSIAWREEVTPTVASTPGTPVTGETVAEASPSSSFRPVTLDEGGIEQYRPNEMGRIPILMYHAFSTDPAELGDWTRTPESLREDLDWLYAHDFHVVSLASMINNELEVPPGKHPVVLTFDDSNSTQLRLVPDAEGTLVPEPETAVGVLEAFFADHPDFGRGGFFSVLPYKCFSFDGEQTTCEERLTWLDDHGYEIGNHTWGHQNLDDVSDEQLIMQVGRTKVWIDERVTGDGNLGNVLVLPFGNWPGYDSQIQMLHEGFVYEGQQIALAGIVGVQGGPSPSPSSGDWTRWNISRFNTDDETWSYWKDQIETGAISIFTSDGNPATVTVPDPIPADVAPQWDPEWASSYGMEVIRYAASPEAVVTPVGSPPASPEPGSMPTVVAGRRRLAPPGR